MLSINYVIYGNNEEFIQEISNSHMSAQEFLKILSEKHDKLFHHLYFNEKEIDSTEILINVFKKGYNIFTVSDKPIFNYTNIEEFINGKSEDSECAFNLKYTDNSEDSDYPDNSEDPDNSDNSEDPDNPDNSEDPDNSDNSENDNYGKLTITRTFNVDEFKVLNKDKGKTTRYLVSKKSDPNLKFYVETLPFIGENSRQFIMLIAEKLLNISHPSISRYIGFSSIDFSHHKIPVIFSTFYSKKSLENVYREPFFNNTHIIISIYGIAAGSLYLLENGICFDFPHISNIQLDKFLYPKISFLRSSSFINDRMTLFDFFKLLDPSEYNPEPHIVFLFGFLVYELIMKQKPFKYMNMFEIERFKIGKRPEIAGNIRKCYRELILSCWKYEPYNRPQLESILYDLKNNKDFLEGVDVDAYYNYIDIIDKNKPQKKDDNSNDNEMWINEKLEHVWLKEKINDFIKNEKIGEGLFSEVYKVENIFDKTVYSAKISISNNNKNICNEAYFLCELDHPCILKLFGYNPTNFEDENKPVILTEYLSNGSLKNLFDYLKYGLRFKYWIQTQKLMIIYGIVSCMSYIHSKDIIHRDLKPSNILLDDYLLPKLSNFCYSQGDDVKILDNSKIIHKATKYCSPEVLEKGEYSKASDVYSFGMILFEIITGKKAFEEYYSYQLIDKILKGKRPSFDKNTPFCFIQLINKCWSKDQNERPSFSEISNELKTNKSFLDGVNKDIFMKYINLIDNYESGNTNLNFISKIDLREIYQNFIKQLSINPSAKKIKTVDYNVIDKIGEGSFGIIYKIKKIENDEFFAAKISKTSIQNLDIEKLIDLYREINIISRLNHPCILKFIGFSEDEPIFHKNKMMIVTEFLSGGSLKSVLDNEQRGLSLPQWNITTKLINIYGIAAGLSHLHHLNIIHRDLKPENILLDSKLYPKIADFGFSKDISENPKYAPDPLYFLKGTPKYCSPEILSKNCYLKQGDIYAFGLIIFEIVTNEIPFKNITNYYTLINEIVYNKATLLFPDNIQECYKKLIKDCLSYEPEKRPTIDEIFITLRNDSIFLENGVDEGVFNDYVDYIDDFLSHSCSIINPNKFKIGNEHEKNNLNKESELNIKKIREKNYIKEYEQNTVENIEFLTKKYIKENDTENIYKYFLILINKGKCEIPLEYAINLYNNKYFHQAFNYFNLISKANHPIVKFFIGVMKYNGKGCKTDKKESYKILKNLSDNGIDMATDFLKDNYEQVI